jgi:hypothetical protein
MLPGRSVKYWRISHLAFTKGDTMRARYPTTRVHGLVVAASLATGFAATAQAAQPAQSRAAWKAAILHTALPAKGCFVSSFPSPVWTREACVIAPQIPLVPRTGNGSRTVGDGSDFTATTTGLISSSIGSFDSVKHVKTETGAGQSNAYTLQLNSQFFSNSPACDGAKNPASCQAWQQFVFYNPGYVFMQYWLIDYAASCPKGYFSYGSDCYTNSESISVPSQPIKQLRKLVLTGQSVAGGMDTVTLQTADGAFHAVGEDTVVDLADFWQAAEFNIFGPGGGSEADFNAKSTLVVRTTIDDGTTNAPSCASEGFTGETNNLNLVQPCTATGGKAPAIVFTETNKTKK